MKADAALWAFSWDKWEGNDDPEKEKALRSEYNIAISNLYLMAPDDVMLAVSKYHWSNVPTGPTSDEGNELTPVDGKQLYSTMIMTMRRDVFEETELDIDQFGEHLPWNWGSGR